LEKLGPDIEAKTLKTLKPDIENMNYLFLFKIFTVEIIHVFNVWLQILFTFSKPGPNFSQKFDTARKMLIEFDLNIFKDIFHD